MKELERRGRKAPMVAQRAAEDPVVVADIFTPQAGPQTQYWRTCYPEHFVYEVLYGGAAGGGKTSALTASAAIQTPNRDYSAVLFRRTYKQLNEPDSLVAQSRRFYNGTGAYYLRGDHRWMFPSGAEIVMRHLQHEDDKYDYQGAAYVFAGFDQLEQFTESQYLYLFSRVRSAVGGMRAMIRSSANPGAEWVLRRWLPWLGTDEELKQADLPRAEPGQPLWFARDETTDEEFLAGPDHPDALSRTFIPANLYDNKILMEKDPDYEKRLKAMPLVDRRRLLHGDWHVKEGGGMYFRREWWPEKNFHDNAPAMKKLARGFDFAAGEKEQDDYTATGLMGIDMNDRDWFLDAKQEKLSPAGAETFLMHHHEGDSKSIIYVIAQDPGQAGKAQVARWRKMLRGRTVHFPREIRDKTVKAGPLSTAVEGMDTQILRGPWNSMMINTLINFPSPDWNDDLVDAFSLAYAGLDFRGRAKVMGLGTALD